MTTTNDDIMSRIEELDQRFVAERSRNDERYVRRVDFDARMVALEERIERMPVEIVRQVSSTLQAMVRDAMKSAIHEEREAERKRDREQFAILLRESREAERKISDERRGRLVREVLTTRRGIALLVTVIGATNLDLASRYLGVLLRALEILE